jgi:polo-like kinase 1
MLTSNKPKLATIVEERITKVNGDFHIKKYIQGDLLGKGGFAKVYKFTNLETNKLMAGKIMPKANFTRSRSRMKLMSEIKLHKILHHPNIVKFEHVFEDQDNVYILLELCANQSLNDLAKRRKRLTEFEVQCYLIQMVDSLKYLHSNRIIHRDLKLGNFFINENMQIKLGDFGLAAKLEFDGEKKRTVCGTPNYIAPEILDGEVGHSYEVDVWSLGVMIYTLIIGKPPFETNDIKLTYQRIKENNYSFPDNVAISENAKDLITKILITAPEKRLTLDEIIRHPFIDHGGPVPKLMPLSTLACPPTPSYMKQFSATRTSQRIRIATEPDGDDDKEILEKQVKAFFVNTARANQAPTTPSGNQIPLNGLSLTTRNSTKFEIGGRRGSDYVNPFFANTPFDKKSPLSPQLNDFLKTENLVTEEDPEITKRIRGAGSRNSLKSPQELPIKEEAVEDEEDVFVVKWYDYTSKYGLGYVLSNGAIGVSFNDGTKIIASNKENFEYIVRRSSDKKEIIQKYTSINYPQDIHKKTLVLAHFRKHFELSTKENPELQSSCYIKKWITTKQAVLFRMSNRLLQATFKDDSLLLLNSVTKKLTFRNKDITITCEIDKAASSNNKELTKRLKYIEDVLKNIWDVQSGQTRIVKTEPNEDYESLNGISQATTVTSN